MTEHRTEGRWEPGRRRTTFVAPTSEALTRIGSAIRWLAVGIAPHGSCAPGLEGSGAGAVEVAPEQDDDPQERHGREQATAPLEHLVDLHLLAVVL